MGGGGEGEGRGMRGVGREKSKKWFLVTFDFNHANLYLCANTPTADLNHTPPCTLSTSIDLHCSMDLVCL